MKIHKLIKKGEKITVGELAQRYFKENIYPEQAELFYRILVQPDSKIKIDDSKYPIMVERK